ncbi:DUF92 domain-containing protein [Bacillus sp. V5-8f]|uniref:DUF92 domain-containing protein n=1 Tax=Bacillus sp. V5-8f TaxID=2053044 RepID=UPI000C780581|nr:DUF92 domain-containing protein [Bacillus sp. V5-8f]PLT34707.1 DUF92 domain-containing protein [Bacillus sp. V5-8f]
MLDNFFYFCIIVITAYAGWKVKSLSRSGAIATVFVGTSVAIGFQLPGLLLLGLFFATSSFWSKYKSASKRSIEEKLEKGDARDWQQVLANGGNAALASCVHFLYPSEMSLVAFIVSIAAANSDTWASEIGVLSKRRPFYILTLKPAEPGTSGAVSLLGSIAGFLGAGFIAVSAIYLFKLSWTPLLAFVTVFGFLGNLIDTLFGAVVQARFRCEACGLETEKNYHCGKETLLVKGRRSINNDVINLSSITIACLIALLMIPLF